MNRALPELHAPFPTTTLFHLFTVKLLRSVYTPWTLSFPAAFSTLFAPEAAPHKVTVTSLWINPVSLWPCSALSVCQKHG